ncbi:hypothetical protein TWF694_005599 [Orbilia ellipsospora]|uniref:WSC domain-containing protein n=1 Tax=Orbilia ellipsospora TaxID=2528407 RepID=A0AAV9WTM0_9PEZI
MKVVVIGITAITFATTAFAVPSNLESSHNHELEKRTAITTYFPPDTSEFTQWQYQGCYDTNVDLTYDTGLCSCMNAKWKPTKKAPTAPFSMEKCFQACKGAGFRYAGIKGGMGAKKCWCGSGIEDGDKLSSDSNCNAPCAESEGACTSGSSYDNNKCGSANAYSIWKDPCFKPYDADSASGNYTYSGCFYFQGWGTILTELQKDESGDNLSQDSCIEACAGKGYAYAGMSASKAAAGWTGNKCYCGGKIAQQWITRHENHPLDNSKCTVLCSATAKVHKSISKDSYQYCGGDWYMSIFFNEDLTTSETCSPGQPVSSSASPPPPASSSPPPPSSSSPPSEPVSSSPPTSSTSTCTSTTSTSSSAEPTPTPSGNGYDY